MRSLTASAEGDPFQVRTATLDEPDHGLTEAALAATDVLLWWGHIAHDQVSDGVVDRVQHASLRVWAWSCSTRVTSPGRSGA